MDERKYKKTYRPFIVWLIVCPVLFSLSSVLLENRSDKFEVSFVLWLTMLSICVLMLIIRRGEYIYWIHGGPTFEQAKKAGSEVRKEYADAHLKVFNRMFAVGTAYLVGSQMLNFDIWIDIVVICLVILICAFRTMTIKFNS